MFVCVSFFPLVSVLVSLLYDDRCFDTFQILNDVFDKNRQNDNTCQIIKKSQTVCLYAFKTITFRVSPKKVIMIGITFTMSILCVNLEPTTFFYMSFPEVIMIAYVFTSLKH